eukprot:19223-Eustigmatos_ZCMA.PRE.1
MAVTPPVIVDRGDISGFPQQHRAASSTQRRQLTASRLVILARARRLAPSAAPSSAIVTSMHHTHILLPLPIEGPSPIPGHLHR